MREAAMAEHLVTPNAIHPGAIEGRVAGLIEPALAAMGYELVRIVLQGDRRPTLQIMVERSDEAAMRVEDCEAVSTTVSALLDVHDPIAGAYTLEVSSPGIDRPLTRAKDWTRFAGHLATAELAEPIDGRKRFKGTILGLDGEGAAAAARLRLDDGTEALLPLAGLRRARLVLTDALIAATEPKRPPPH